MARVSELHDLTALEQGAALRARTWATQQAEAVLRAVVHNLMLLAAGP